MKIKRLYLFFVLASDITFAGPTAEWINKQWAQIPEEMRLEKPSPHIEIPFHIRELIGLEVESVQRNRYVSKSYYEISKKLKSCLAPNLKIANWYTFATWASMSAGEAIDGSKFDRLNPVEKALFRAGVEGGAIKDIPYQKKVFSMINTQVGIEQIQVSLKFLEMFCGEERNNLNDFLKLIPDDGNIYFFWLKKAFEQYYLSLSEQDQNLKFERITLAAVYQMLSEQMRLQPSMKLVIPVVDPESGLGLQLQSRIVALASTIHGKLKYGREFKRYFNLTRSVRTKGMVQELRRIDLLAFQKINKEYKLSNHIKGRFFPKTGCLNWGEEFCRLKHLNAMFRSNMTNKYLFERPKI